MKDIDYARLGKYSALFEKTLKDGHIYNPRLDRRNMTMQVIRTKGEAWTVENVFEKLPREALDLLKTLWYHKNGLMDIYADITNAVWGTKRTVSQELCNKYGSANLTSIIDAKYNVPLKRIARTASYMVQEWEYDASVATDPVLKSMYEDRVLFNKLKDAMDDIYAGNDKTEGVNICSPSVPFVIEFMASYARYVALRNFINYPKHWSGVLDMGERKTDPIKRDVLRNTKVKIDPEGARKILERIKTWEDAQKINGYDFEQVIFVSLR